MSCISTVGASKQHFSGALASKALTLTQNSAASIEESVKEDMRTIKNDPYLPKAIEVIGYTLDVFSGKTQEVAVM